MAAANARRLLAAGACSLIGVRARIARRRGSRGDASAHVPRVSMLLGRHGVAGDDASHVRMTRPDQKNVYSNTGPRMFRE